MFMVFYKFYILIIEDNTRLIGCLVSRKNNTFCFLWVKVCCPRCLKRFGQPNIFLVCCCCPIMCLYVLSSVLCCPLRFLHKNDVQFILTSSCLQDGSCFIYVILVCLPQWCPTHIVLCVCFSQSCCLMLPVSLESPFLIACIF